MDALATPFVQGRLTQKAVSAVVQSQCAHSGQSLTIDIDHQLLCQARQAGARPLVFAPLKVARPGAPSIIDDF
ncbi:MAG: hypothetical protein V1806_17830 [Pseudomonadota bacterium]